MRNHQFSLSLASLAAKKMACLHLPPVLHLSAFKHQILPSTEEMEIGQSIEQLSNHSNGLIIYT